MTYDTLENIIVGLYRANDTINIFNGSPYYFTEVNDEGQFLIENIKNGKYLMYAFNDENKNLRLETNKETYGFVADTLQLDSGTYHTTIDLVSLDLTDFKMLTASVSGPNFDLNFNKYITDYHIQPLDSSYKLYTSPAKENKSIRVYNTFETIDSLQVTFNATDSINTTISDTLNIKFTESKRKPEDLKIDLKPEKNTQIQERIPVEITFNKPILYTNTDSMFVRFDTTRILQINDTLFSWTKNRNKLLFDLTIDRSLTDTLLSQRNRLNQLLKDSLAEQQNLNTEKRQISKEKSSLVKQINKGLQLYLGYGSFISVELDTSKNITANYSFVAPEENGTQTVNIFSDYTSYTVQLLTENLDIVDEISNNNKNVFKHIPPGKYKIRVLIDSNGDGEWSPGNMLERIEPEPVYIYPDPLVIRADWQTSLDISF
ncbi:MAG: hypothetical protein HC819_20665 [Cyclobacteriaceae bacterium]|nr:hypothetical protein [Cyclobacteriaceae bacterium]